MAIHQVCLYFIDSIAVIRHVMERRRAAGTHVLWRPPDLTFETGRSTDSHWQIVGKSRHIGTGDSYVEVKHWRIAIGHDCTADAKILAIDAAFDIR